ncbi:MAG: MetS family NSS transporter small subunit [Candidatus Zixiibacteriota bacterium]
MPISAVVMLIITCMVLFGGIAICLSISFRKKKE